MAISPSAHVLIGLAGVVAAGLSIFGQPPLTRALPPPGVLPVSSDAGNRTGETARLRGDVAAAFRDGRYDRVIELLESAPPDRLPGQVLVPGVRSYLRVGRADAALALYLRLVPPDRPEQAQLLKDIALGFLVAGVRDREEHVRLSAYTALADLNRPEMIPVLQDGLLDPSITIRAKAAAAQGRFSAKAASASLTAALDDPAPAVRIAALNAVRPPAPPRLTEKIARLAASVEGPVQVFALAALVRLGKRQALNDIIQGTAEPDAETRMAAIGVLGKLKPSNAASILLPALYDPVASVRAFAAGALGELGAASAGPALTQALGDESPEVRRVAATSLGRLGLQQSRPALWQAMRDPVPSVRAGALEGLLRLGDSDAVLAAGELIKQPDPIIRSAAAQALALRGNTKAIPLLAQLLRDQQPQPRLTAARALGTIGAATAIPSLKHALRDSDPAVRMAAAGSLAGLPAGGR